MTDAPAAGTYCPDCDKHIYDDFIAHREAVHPPKPITVAPKGINSREGFGWQGGGRGEAEAHGQAGVS